LSPVEMKKSGELIVLFWAPAATEFIASKTTFAYTKSVTNP